MNAEQKQRALTALGMWHSSNDSSQREYQAAELMAALLQELVDAPEAEPFGYFKAEPLGWTDCAETDDGAIALYELPPAPSAPDMPLSMEQFGGLVGLARDDASEKAIVYKATNIYGETCYFGVKSTAQAWAKSGSVDEVRLRDLRVVATPTQPDPARTARRCGAECVLLAHLNKSNAANAGIAGNRRSNRRSERPIMTKRKLVLTALWRELEPYLGKDVPDREVVLLSDVKGALASAPLPPKLSDELILEIYAEVSGRPVTMGKNRIIDFARAVEREILGGDE